jgi:hypothetical protein
MNEDPWALAGVQELLCLDKDVDGALRLRLAAIFQPSLA